MFSTNRDAKAWEYIEMALMKASCIGDWLLAALALEYVSYGYLHKGDYQNVYGAYEVAAKKYVGTAYPYDEERCNGNMARIKHTNSDICCHVTF